MAEREYYCVDCGRTHAASLWYVRQVLSDTLPSPRISTS